MDMDRRREGALGRPAAVVPPPAKQAPKETPKEAAVKQAAAADGKQEGKKEEGTEKGTGGTSKTGKDSKGSGGSSKETPKKDLSPYANASAINRQAEEDKNYDTLGMSTVNKETFKDLKRDDTLQLAKTAKKSNK